ncbi:hypothetical protein [Amycolatopsis echigonensis]|uniref:Uncharacterized protein n=1 Tax=Amycolatopsis echigonensis TaxID=2576905 RepID=A0A2N3WAV1_9PSEU|nr:MULTISPECIES: hypothetical protein [Amycolatopsis]MBB2503717.1 hypothetical protein [Amycolatopsis echigonensis]PKV91000.1 hypothetical protein ATK30_1760 [Amycolatopsis niigatensis]
MQTIERPTDRDRLVLAKGFVAAYGVVSAVVLGAIAARALSGGEVSSFMWIRSGVVVVSAAVSWWLVSAAARGSRAAYLRMRLIAIVAPVAIVGVDLIPGACPLWFLLAQTGCAVVLAGAAVPLVSLRATFPK